MVGLRIIQVGYAGIIAASVIAAALGVIPWWGPIEAVIIIALLYGLVLWMIRQECK